jgi:titin
VADSDAATVTIEVTNVTPVANDDDQYSMLHDQTLTVSASNGVLANDTDGDNDPLTAILDTQPAYGAVSLNADGSFTYTPPAAYAGTVTFTYHANDGVADSNIATVTIVVGNEAPIANDDTGYTVVHGRTLTIDAAGVLANDSDPDGDSLTAILVDRPDHGTVSVGSNGIATYTPNAGFVGDDSFSYTITDPYGATATAMIYVSVLES